MHTPFIHLPCNKICWHEQVRLRESCSKNFHSHHCLKHNPASVGYAVVSGYSTNHLKTWVTECAHSDGHNPLESGHKHTRILKTDNVGRSTVNNETSCTNSLLWINTNSNNLTWANWVQVLPGLWCKWSKYLLRVWWQAFCHLHHLCWWISIR